MGPGYLYRNLAHAPKMLRAWIDIAWPLRHEAETPRPLRELVIMRVGQLTGARYEWAHHWRMALNCGVPEVKLRALRDWPQSDQFSEVERAILAFTDAVVQQVHVPEEVFAEVSARFPPQHVVELTLTAAFYCNVVRVLGALDVDVEPEYAAALEAM
jgi:alkylhydroperoxidase family enzyme